MTSDPANNSAMESSAMESSAVESSAMESSAVESSAMESSAMDSSAIESSIMESSIMTAPGRAGNLTAEQEAGLRELWKLTLRVLGVQDPRSRSDTNSSNTNPANSASETKDSDAATNASDGRRKSRFSMLGWRKSQPEVKKPTSETASVDSAVGLGSNDASNDKFGQTKEFRQAVAEISPQTLRQTFWNSARHENPDNLLLRFLRARKWNVQAALVMMISTVRWRLMDVRLDDDMMLDGEQCDDKEFVDQLRMGKAYLHGKDAENRPMCFVRVRLHRIGQCSEKSLERLIVYTIETGRLLLHETDTATIIFDMTNFSLANMDYTPVKIVIKCLEANYPESLGAVIIHKAPWIFQGIWTIIRGWLDPVVAGKVHFTKTTDELAEMIPRDRMPKELEGDEDWEWKYPEPVTGENKLKEEDKSTGDALQKERMDIVKEYEDATLAWISAANSQSTEDEKAAKDQRKVAAEKLRQNYWRLDPYVRTRSYLDRNGIIGQQGNIDLYPKATGTANETLDGSS